MNRLRRTLSFRRKNKSIQNEAEDWLEDERKVRDGTCCFQVKYLGCIEVLEGTGLAVCEEAMKLLRQNAKKSERLSFRKKKRRPCPVLAMLHVSGDSLRLVEYSNLRERIPIFNRDDTQGLIVDQAVEKVSFCAPERLHTKAFSYICRDSTTRRWMCHGFVTLRETGERLSHAVGCAFGVCLGKKQEREKELVEAMYNADRTSFVRQGSFKQASLTERMMDPQSIKIVEPSSTLGSQVIPETSGVERPRPVTDMITSQHTHTEFPALSNTYAFKRGVSLRLNDLPSTLQRQAEDAVELPKSNDNVASAVNDSDWDPISAFCRQITEGLFSADTDDSVEETQATSTQTKTSAVKMDCLPSADLELTQMVSSNMQPVVQDAATTMRRQSNTNPFTPRLCNTNYPSCTNPFITDHMHSPEFVVNM